MKIENVIRLGVSSVMAASLMVACGPKARPGSAIQTKAPTPAGERAQKDLQKATAEKLAKLTDEQRKKSLELSNSIAGLDYATAKVNEKNVAVVSIQTQTGDTVGAIDFGGVEMITTAEKKGAKGKTKGTGETADKKIKIDLSCESCDEVVMIEITDVASKAFAAMLVTPSDAKTGLKVGGIEKKYADKAGLKAMGEIRKLLAAVQKTAVVRQTKTDVVDLTNLEKISKTVTNILVKGEQNSEASILAARAVVVSGETSDMKPVQQTGVFKEVTEVVLKDLNRIQIATGTGDGIVAGDMEIVKRADDKSNVVEIVVKQSDSEKLAEEIKSAQAEVTKQEGVLSAAKEKQGKADEAVVLAKKNIEEAKKGTVNADAMKALEKALADAEKAAGEAKAAVEKADGDLKAAQAKLKDLEAKKTK